jgi:hypothetical protein
MQWRLAPLSARFPSVTHRQTCSVQCLHDAAALRNVTSLSVVRMSPYGDGEERCRRIVTAVDGKLGHVC